MFFYFKSDVILNSVSQVLMITSNSKTQCLNNTVKSILQGKFSVPEDWCRNLYRGRVLLSFLHEFMRYHKIQIGINISH